MASVWNKGRYLKQLRRNIRDMAIAAEIEQFPTVSQLLKADKSEEPTGTPLLTE